LADNEDGIRGDFPPLGYSGNISFRNRGKPSGCGKTDGNHAAMLDQISSTQEIAHLIYNLVLF
jgi:hypothetical protein